MLVYKILVFLEFITKFFYFFNFVYDYYSIFFVVVRFEINWIIKREKKKKEKNGPNKANSSQIDWRQSAAQTVGHESGAQVSAKHWRRQKAAQIPSGHRGAERDQKVPEEHGAADPTIAVSAFGKRDRSRL